MGLKERHDCYDRPNSITVTKSRKMGWAKYAAVMKDAKSANSILLWNILGRPRCRCKTVNSMK